MPSPRFGRLSVEKRQRIVAVARAHLARDGIAGASYNRIIAEAAMSKTTAYLYFDGKDDLVREVLRDLAVRLSAVIGQWVPASSARLFWMRLTACGEALHRHLLDHPDDLALLKQVPPNAEESQPDTDGWFEAVVDNGIELGVIRSDVDRSLLLAATRAIFRVADDYVLARLCRGESVDIAPTWALLRGLWAPPKQRPKGRR